MKLRSGKILLPPVISKELYSNLKELKELLRDSDKKFVTELITTIANAEGRGVRGDIDYIRDKYNNYKTDDLDSYITTTRISSCCGSLYRLVFNSPIYEENNIEFVYHDQIRDIILSTFELPLIGE